MSNLQKIINLIKKTGDSCIVLDHKGNPAYVVMIFDDYNRMVLNKFEVAGLSEDELSDKINRDVAIWKAGQDVENLDNWQSVESVVEEVKKSSASQKFKEKPLNKADNSEDSENSDEKYYFEPID